MFVDVWLLNESVDWVCLWMVGSSIQPVLVKPVTNSKCGSSFCSEFRGKGNRRTRTLNASFKTRQTWTNGFHE